MTNTDMPLAGITIAFFHQSADLYGSDRILLNLAEGVKNSGGQVIVLLPSAGPLTIELNLKGIEYHIVPVLKISRARFTLIGMIGLIGEIFVALPSYFRILHGRQIDVIHSNTIAVMGGALWALFSRAHHLWHVHEIIEKPKIASKLFPFLLKFLSNQVICNSQATFNWVINAQPDIESKTSVILNGIVQSESIDQNSVAVLEKKFKPQGANVAIGLVGRINRWKGHFLLIEAAEIIQARGVGNFSIVFIGSPPDGQEHYEIELKERIKKSPMRDHIVLCGFEKDVWPSYAALDIVCVPSTDPEPFGLVAVEAMAMAKPIVASRFGGLVEIVVDCQTGLLINPGDAQSLSLALELLIDNPSDREKYGQMGFARFSKLFSVSQMNSEFKNAYLRQKLSNK